MEQISSNWFEKGEDCKPALDFSNGFEYDFATPLPGSKVTESAMDIVEMVVRLTWGTRRVISHVEKARALVFECFQALPQPGCTPHLYLILCAIEFAGLHVRVISVVPGLIMDGTF